MLLHDGSRAVGRPNCHWSGLQTGVGRMVFKIKNRLLKDFDHLESKF